MPTVQSYCGPQPSRPCAGSPPAPMPRPPSHKVACMKVAVVKETAPTERRVALVPDAVAKLRAAGLEVLVETGAGDGAWLSDDAFTEAGATIGARAEPAGSAERIGPVGRAGEHVHGPAPAGPPRRGAAARLWR